MSTGQTSPRPPIEPAMEREVRRRCGFGCIICGLPLYEYDHILGWANVQRHVAEEITLLCDMHHREKTNGLLPLEGVIAANQEPYNLRQGVSKPYDLHYSGTECETIIGSNKFTTRDLGDGTFSAPLVIDGVPIVAFVLSDGHLLLNLLLFDDDNNLVLQIERNELQYSVSPWDIKLRGRNLVIRAAERKILVDIVFEVPNRIVIRRGRLLLNGVEIILQPDYALIVNNGNLLWSNEAGGGHFGLVVGNQDTPAPAAFRFPNIPRYSGSTVAAMRHARRRVTAGNAMRARLRGA
jgi:hypothetical protein